MSKLDAYGSKWFAATWDMERENGLITLKGYSVFIQVAKSQLVVELMSFNSGRLEEYSQFLHVLEPRMTQERVNMFLGQEYHSDVVIASVSRAVSDMTVMSEVERFYIEGVGANKTMSIDNFEAHQSSLFKRCFQWPLSAADVCFTTYVSESDEVSMTNGSFTPVHFEEILHASHEHWLRGAPACANDKWVDNHYAVDLGSKEDSLFYDVNPLLRYVLKEGTVYTCGGGPHGQAARGAHYVIDPTGWGVQLDVEDGDAITMPLCDEVRESIGGESKVNPGPASWCGKGTCLNSDSITQDDESDESEGISVSGEGQSEEVEGDSSEVPYSFPSFIAFVLVGGACAFLYGFTRGGGTPQALLLGTTAAQHEYELVNRHAAQVVEGADDDGGFFEDEDAGNVI